LSKNFISEVCIKLVALRINRCTRSSSQFQKRLVTPALERGPNISPRAKGITRGERGAPFPGRQITAGTPKSPNIVTRTFSNTVHLFRKTSGSNMGGSKLASLPGRHLTSLRPFREVGRQQKALIEKFESSIKSVL